MNISRSLKKGLALGAALFALCVWSLPAANAQIPGGTLNPTTIPKYATPLLIPPVLPKAGTIVQKGGKNVDYYEISVRQFSQQILPAGAMAAPSTGGGRARGERGQSPPLAPRRVR